MRYWAFISYSHLDRRVARWLRDSLAETRVPAAKRKLVDPVSVKFSTVFLDEQEAAATSSLSEELRRALAQSRKLVVICSPFAVASHVSADIIYFLNRGRDKDIICVIAAGIPNATDEGNPAFECLPAPLRFVVDDAGQLTSTAIPVLERPLGASLGAETLHEKDTVIRQVTAGVLEFSVSQLANVERKVRQGRWINGLSVLATIGALAAAYWDLRYRPQVHYYEDFVRRNGVWLGLRPLSSIDAKSQDASYSFEQRGRLNPPAEVRLLNGSGYCARPGLKSVLGNTFDSGCNVRFACTARFEYEANSKQVRVEELVDQFGHALEKLTYHGDTEAEFVDGSFGCSRTPSGISNVRFTRFGSQTEFAGFDQRIEFLTNIGGRGEPRPNRDLSYSVGFDYTSDGEVIA